jgi:hypothetical protein
MTTREWRASGSRTSFAKAIAARDLFARDALIS